jgi:hypothetical protein
VINGLYTFLSLSQSLKDNKFSFCELQCSTQIIRVFYSKLHDTLQNIACLDRTFSWFSSVPLLIRWDKNDGKIVAVHAVKAYRGAELWLHSFLTSAPDGGEWLTPSPGLFTSRKKRRCSLNRRVAGPQNRSGRFGQIKIFCPCLD